MNIKDGEMRGREEREGGEGGRRGREREGRRDRRLVDSESDSSWMGMCVQVQWSPSIMDTIGNQNSVRNSEMSLTKGLPVYFQ